MEDTTERQDLPVLIIGAGPVGLAAAARLSIEGQPFVVLEAGQESGVAVRQWGHVRLFTPWRRVGRHRLLRVMMNHGDRHDAGYGFGRRRTPRSDSALDNARRACDSRPLSQTG